MNSVTSSNKIYHERQSKMFCALHALNNVFQDKIFSKHCLDKIADNLNSNSLINPHRNVFGLGNYDANVLVIALQQCGYDIVWCDKRKTIAAHNLNFDNIFGYILNTFSNRRIFNLTLPYSGSHWIGLRKLEHDDKYSYFNLDSKLCEPVVVASTDDEFVNYLEGRLREYPETQLLFVVSNEVLQQRSWTHNKQ
ncbi:unnamed protein product [Schistosoma spindalis]|nr:unnamed protein product [Schistosoma spindale]